MIRRVVMQIHRSDGYRDCYALMAAVVTTLTFAGEDDL